MKKFLTFALLCFVGSLTFANDHIQKSTKQLNLKQYSDHQIYYDKFFEDEFLVTSIDLQEYTCTAVTTIKIYQNNEVVHTITRSATLSMPYPFAVCETAQAFAQQEAQDAVADWLAAQQTITPE